MSINAIVCLLLGTFCIFWGLQYTGLVFWINEIMGVFAVIIGVLLIVGGAQ